MNDEDTEKGWIYISGGTITAVAASDGVDAGNFLEIDGGTIEIAAGDDGLHAEYGAVVNGGTISVTQSYEVLEGSYVTVTGGTLSLVSSDDGINAAGEPTEDAGTEDAGGMAAAPSMQDSGNASGAMPSAPGGQSTGSGAGTAPSGMAGGAGGMEADDTASITMAGGTIEILAGGDGIDSNGDLTIEGGTVYVSGPEDGGNGSLDYAGTGTISGGTLICAGSAGMAQTLEAGGSQGVAMVSLSGSVGDTISVTDSTGTVLASMEAKASYECVIVSCPGMVEDGTYTVTNGSDTAEVTLEGLSYSESGTFGGSGMGQDGGIPEPCQYNGQRNLRFFMRSASPLDRMQGLSRNARRTPASPLPARDLLWTYAGGSGCSMTR
ncbi:MAG: carbohydrate-binding domain-containing protein [Coriobacteriaceae bacterium]|nr:MAG: carbohydrate-binding domain-containing protein [Coriobacteriaceae bacterium]